MLDSFFFSMILGFLLSILAGLGTGGGSLLLVCLTVIQGMEPQIAQTINLLFFLTSAGIISAIRLKRRSIPIKKILPGILAGCLAAAGFSILGRYFNADIIRKAFGVLLLITGLRELFYRPRNAK